MELNKDQSCTYYEVEFINKGANEHFMELYRELLGRKFVFRFHRKFGLDRAVANLKLCFGQELVTTFEAQC